MVLEKILDVHGRLVWGQRINESIFIGNYENIVSRKASEYIGSMGYRHIIF